MEDISASPAQARPANTPSSSVTGQTWNTTLYAANGRFVADLAVDLVELLSPRPADLILDVGCGDGVLTERLASTGATVLGVDASAAMVAAARQRGLEVLHASASSLPFDSEFSAVFSNAALHWIPAEDQATTLASIYRALIPGGRFVAEMGGQGNIAAIRTAVSCVLDSLGIDAEAAARSFFPSPLQYRTLLETAGFTVQSISLIPRPTLLPHGPDGLRTWLDTFRSGVFDRLDPLVRQTAFNRVVSLLQPILTDPSGSWTADYVRLRFQAIRPS